MTARTPAIARPPWPELLALDAQLADGERGFDVFRRTLAEGSERLAERFEEGEAVGGLVADRAALIDAVLTRVWRHNKPGLPDTLALVAVGGYGRAELHPCSDIDIMVLVPGDKLEEQWQTPLGAFVTLLWDIGLEVGHSVRTVTQCSDEARNDITVATSLMEARLLLGNRMLFESMRRAVGPDRIWPPRAFFEEKLREQTARHHRYHDTAYNLEPNVKGSPGGLRDIQMIGWVAKRHFGADSLHQLVSHGFLSAHEYKSLRKGREFLWKIRFGLHLLTGRREDRLLFDHQATLAQRFGYKDMPHTLAVEQLMQNYYRTVMRLSRLNEMLLQLFREAILTDGGEVVRLNDEFQVRNNHLEVTRPHLFEESPSALLRVFRMMQLHEQLQGVSASTIRLIRRHRDKINESFRQDPVNHALFLDILKASRGVTHELRRMNRYGVLGRYIPAFGRISGRMQYDLFHAYTVDAHTLFVVSNLRRFALSRFDHEFPYCSQIMQLLPRPELAYLAALFHDIAKGRGGDHSELGAVDAEQFCLLQGLSRYDARVVAWLVKHHLVLSVTAQKKDISDPQVVNGFAAMVGDQLHLDYLYVLTVADVRATNEKMWNSWKASLFESFYLQTKRALARGLENPIDKEELILETREKARRLLNSEDVPFQQVDSAWTGFSEDYFLYHTPEEIAWHGRMLATLDSDRPDALVSVQARGPRGGTAVLVYSTFARFNFARVTAVLDGLGLNIVDARITPTGNGYSLDSYLVLQDTGEPIVDQRQIDAIESALRRAFADDSTEAPRITRRTPRQVRAFHTPTRIDFVMDMANRRTIMELIATDRPGILSAVGRSFRAADVNLHTAKITTVGARAEDVFYLTDAEGQPLSEQACAALHDELLDELGDTEN